MARLVFKRQRTQAEDEAVSALLGCTPRGSPAVSFGPSRNETPVLPSAGNAEHTSEGSFAKGSPVGAVEGTAAGLGRRSQDGAIVPVPAPKVGHVAVNVAALKATLNKKFVFTRKPGEPLIKTIKPETPGKDVSYSVDLRVTRHWGALAPDEVIIDYQHIYSSKVHAKYVAVCNILNAYAALPERAARVIFARDELRDVLKKWNALDDARNRCEGPSGLPNKENVVVSRVEPLSSGRL